MKRFFIKKSVAIIFTTIISLVVFSPFNFVSAQTSADTSVEEKVVYSTTSRTFTYFGNGQWLKEGTGNYISTSLMLNTPSIDMPQEYADAAIAYDVKNGTLGNSNSEQTVLGWIGMVVGEVVKYTAGGIVDTTTSIIAIVIQVILIPLASIFLAITGSILDFSLQYTIFGTGFSIMKSSIQGVWVLMRDTANVFFIFILLYAAIQQIISNTGSTARKTLTSVIIAAVLINFSLFFTRIIIDAGNLVATSIYGQITRTVSSSGNVVGNLLTQAGTSLTGVTTPIDLSGRIMDGIGLTTMFDTGGSGAQTDMAKTVFGIGGLLSSVIQLVTYYVTIFVFIMLAALLMGRFVMLVILMATSPIGFLFDTIPFVGDFSKKWWSALIDQTLIAPTLMFLMLLTIKLSAILKPEPGVDIGVMQTFFNFFLVTFLLLKSVSIVKKLSGPMGEMAGKLAAVATGAAVAYATGGASLIGRQTVGRGANTLAGSKIGQRLEALGAKGGVVGWTARQTLSGIKGTAASTFDVKNTSTFKQTLGQAEGIAGMSMIDKNYLAASGVYGKGKPTGFIGSQAVAAKKVEETATNYAKLSTQETETEKKAKTDLAEHTKKETELKKKIETATPEEKSNLEKELKVVVEQKTRAEGQTRAGKEKALDNIVKERAAQGQHQDFATADAKVKQFQDELVKFNKEAEEEKKKLIAQGKDVTRFEKDIAETNKKKKEEISRLEKVIVEETDRQGKIRKQVEEEIISGSKSDLKLMLDRKKMKENYANSIRNRISFVTTMQTPSEKEAQAKIAEGINYNAEKEKEKSEKATEAEKVRERAAEILAEKAK